MNPGVSSEQDLMTEESAFRDGLDSLSHAIMTFTEEYCTENNINDADIILSGLGIAMACLIDGTFNPSERIFHARRLADTIIKCAGESMEIAH
jgi:hypothetical protein